MGSSKARGSAGARAQTAGRPSAQETDKAHRRAPSEDDAVLAGAIVDGLVGRGLFGPERAGDARDAVVNALVTRSATETPLRRRLAEVAGYVGGALLVAAAVVFLTEEWGSLATFARVATLATIALVLLGAAVVVVLTGRRTPMPSVPASGPGVRRRLAGALGCGGAVAAAFAVGVLVEDLTAPVSDVPWVVAGLVLVLLGLGVYLLAPSALVQVVVATGAVQVVGSGLETFVESAHEGHVGGVILALGALWLVAAEAGWWRERYAALVVGSLLLLGGGQLPVLGSDHEAWGYLLTAGAAAATVVLYVRTRAVPYLVTAVAGLTLAVPEALLDWTDGSLGPVGVLLATGITLLVASLLGLRLRQGVGGGTGPTAGAAV